MNKKFKFIISKISKNPWPYLAISITFISLIILSIFLFNKSSNKDGPEFKIDEPLTYQSFLGFNRPIDTTIKKTSGKFDYKNTTNRFKTFFKATPTQKDSIVFKKGRSEISFYTPTSQSFGILLPTKSQIDGSSITYQNIFPSVDLKYTVSPTRLLEEFIIQDKTTAKNLTTIDQKVSLKNIDSYILKKGSLSFYNNNQLIYSAPKPVMYELKNPKNTSHGIEYIVSEQSKNQLIVSKNITSEGLSWLSDPNRQYPIIIDLVIDNADTSSSWVSSDTTNTIVTQETTIKQEGTGSVKVASTGEGGTPTTLDLMEYDSTSSAQNAFVSNGANIEATGGTIATDGVDTIHTFTSSGTFTVTGSGDVEYLIVAAGGGAGGGGYNSGGGGAGGFLTDTDHAITTQAYPITVGAGGAGQTGLGQGTDGGVSTFDSITSSGGGGGGGQGVKNGRAGASGGGGCANDGTGGSTSGTGAGNVGGLAGNGGSYIAGGGGGAGAAGASYSAGAHGGVGLTSSISGGSVYYAGGGGGGSNGTPGTGGLGGGGNGSATVGQDGTANTGGGGGGGDDGGSGGSGVVIIRYLSNTLQSYSESSIKTQGSYSLKGVATTEALNKTLISTPSASLDLSDHETINFDIRSTRTGSNIKIGIHDSGGTTTEVTPNITSADTFQQINWDISAVSNASKDAIDRIIITVVNADSANTFYLDDMTAEGHSTDDTVTLTKSSTDLSGQDNITYYVRSDTTGSFARLEFGESASSEQTNAFTINSADTWEQKTWDITSISAADRNAVTKIAFKFTSDTSDAILYFDDIQTTINNFAPSTPSLDLPTDTNTNQILTPILKTTTTDADSDYLQYKIELCENVGMSTNCQTFDQSSSQTGWSGQDAETSTAYASGTQATYTIQSGSPLNAGTTYYWRSYAIDPDGLNAWSDTQGTPYSFTTTSSPSAPSTPYAEGSTNPSGILDITPEFSAIHNDPNADSADYYQLEVDTQVGFDGTQMWDSTKTSMTTTADTVRSPDIPYAGTAISIDGTTYYWRIKFWDVIGAEGAWSATQNFTMNGSPSTPSLDYPSDTDTELSTTTFLKTTTTDTDSDYVRYKIEVCENLGMSTSCRTFDQTSSQTGWSGQDAETSTAYTSGTQATYTIQTGSPLDTDTTYYWRSYAIDPEGSNTWSTTHGTPYSFTTKDAPDSPNNCRVEETSINLFTIYWSDNSVDEDYFDVEKSINGGAYSTLNGAVTPDSTSLEDSSFSAGNYYKYRIAAYFTTGPAYSSWCYTNTLGIDSSSYSGINLKGITIK